MISRPIPVAAPPAWLCKMAFSSQTLAKPTSVSGGCGEGANSRCCVTKAFPCHSIHSEEFGFSVYLDKVDVVSGL